MCRGFWPAPMVDGTDVVDAEDPRRGASIRRSRGELLSSLWRKTPSQLTRVTCLGFLKSPSRVLCKPH